MRIVDTDHRHSGRQGGRVEDLPVIAGYRQPDNEQVILTEQTEQLVLLVSIIEINVHHHSVNIQ